MNKIKINILDMGWGNLEALRFFLLRLGRSVQLIKYQDYLQNRQQKSIVFIPGIGSATDIAKIKKSNLVQLKEKLHEEHLVIGICLGMHLMCSYLEEADIEGLGIFKNDVVRLRNNGTKKSNIGYRFLDLSPRHKMQMYFCHAFGVKIDENCSSKITGYFEYLKKHSHYAASLQKDKFLGLQFHPEKSGQVGLNFIREAIHEHIDSSNSL